ncbi:MAG: metallohydrolase [Acidobacteria bacterium]|nr:MAG: metallohydrolase [Acidobacteriota bacterium]
MSRPPLPDQGGPAVMAPFLLRRLWLSVVPRTGGAPLVPADPSALAASPGLTWIGHASFLVRMDGATFLTDPMFSRRASPLSFAGPRRLVPPGVAIDALPRVDFALVSHDHYDHLDLPSVRALARRGVRFVVPSGVGEIVRRAGGEVAELEWWGRQDLGPVTVHCVPSRHFSGRSLLDRNRRLWAGFVVEGPSRRFYHAGDTASFDGFAEIGRRLGPIDLAAMPIGAYLPRRMMASVHVTPEEAVQGALAARASRIAAMHWGTFDLADEPLDEPPRRFRAEAQRLGLGDDQAWVLGVGETRSW